MLKTWANSNSIEACFIEEKNKFPSNTTRGLHYLARYSSISNEILCGENFFVCNKSYLNKYKNSKILIVGAGPTANERDWKAEDYDYIFSCNHFFLNEKLKNIKVDLCFICDEVDCLSNNFIDYVTKNNTYVGLEDYNVDINKIKKLHNKIGDNLFFCLSRFQGKIGVAPKLALFAAFLGASEIHLVGIDGVPPNYKKGELSNHSFQKGKTWQTSYPYKLILKHYSEFKQFLYNDIGKNCVIKNLGAGHEYNCLSKV